MPSQTDKSQILAFSVDSDIKHLRKVIIHRPDPGIEWVTPSNADSLLYDDIVFLPQMMDQHRSFVEVLKAILGPDAVLEFQELLEELLQDPSCRAQLLSTVVEFEGLDEGKAAFLNRLPAVSLAAVLISGVVPGLHQLVLQPLPNHIFTRDIGVTINGSFLTCLASKTPRMRESILTWFMVHNHPLFSGPDNHTFSLDLCKSPQALLAALADPNLAIEGGDVMVIDKDNVFIGCSERTNEHTIRKVADMLFENNIVKRVTLIDIPKLSTCIHLDTLFTQISKTDFVYYQPYLGKEQPVVIKQFRDSLKNEVSYTCLNDLLLEIIPGMRLIPCGNGRYPYQEREQYASGCNFVALKDGVAVSYARNSKTLEALKEHGYYIQGSAEFLEGVNKGLIDVNTLEQTIITIPSSELSRAGGGPHCLTLPLVRE